MQADELKRKIESLSDLLLHPWFLNSAMEFTKLKGILKDLLDALVKQHKYLADSAARTASNRVQKEPVRGYHDNWYIQHRDATTSAMKSVYNDLHSELDDLDLYEAVCLADYLPTESSYARKLWLDDLKLPYPIGLYSFRHGNNLGTTYFVWKVDPVEVDQQAEMRVLCRIRDLIPIYSTRAMRKDFIETFSNTQQKPAVLRNLYRFLTNDSSAPETSNQAAVDTRVMEFLLSSEDEELIFDLRKNNGRVKDPKYDAFWEELGTMLEEMSTVQERRHGEVGYLPQFISVSDLREQVLSRLPPGAHAPGISWIRLNFQPTNPTDRVATNYTGRFAVKYAVQQRLLRSQHDDAGFCAHLFRLLKNFAVRYRESTCMICLDDKAIVPIGEPRLPISTGVRSHNRSLVPEDSNNLLALDHDFHVAGAIPSVLFDVALPNNARDSFYKGAVHVTVKDKLFEASTPQRHVVETMKILRDSRSVDGVSLDQPILLLYTDGGPDHRTTYKRVQLTLVYMFIALDLDALFAARTAPCQSYANPAERIMSTLNLALQNCSLARSEMSPGMEAKMKSLSTLTSVRRAAERYPTLKEEFTASLAPVFTALHERFSRLKRNDEQVQVHKPATSEEIDALNDMLAVLGVQEKLDLGVVVKQFKTLPPLQAFWETHVRERHYIFQVNAVHDVYGEHVNTYANFINMVL